MGFPLRDKIMGGYPIKVESQAALMLDSGRFNLQANTDKIQDWV